MASFCASETAETGRIANGREQGDHVSRRQGRQKDLIGFVRSRCFGALIRGLENLDVPVKGTIFGTFCGVQKVPQKHAEGCDPLDSRGAIQISARYEIFAEMTGVHQVTGDTEKRRVPGYRR